VSIERCHYCHAYASTRVLSFDPPGRFVCKDLQRCLRSIRVEIYISRLVNREKKNEREMPGTVLSTASRTGVAQRTTRTRVAR
jgi:hypothetical protein